MLAEKKEVAEEVSGEEHYLEKFDLIYRAINNTQEIIRFTDTKSGTVIVLATASTAATASLLDKYLKMLNDLSGHPLSKAILIAGSCVIGILMLTALFLALKSINPARDSSPHVELGEYADIKENIYYLSGLTREMRFADYIQEKQDLKLKLTLSSYFNNLKKVDLDQIMLSLSYDLLKVSYIKEKKIRRTQVALKCIEYCIWTLIATVILVLASKNLE